MLSKRELAFLILWGMIGFPLLLIWLHMNKNLDVQTLADLLVYMAGMKGIYVGAKGFDSWNNSGEDIVTSVHQEIDNGGH